MTGLTTQTIMQMVKDNLHITYVTDESTDRRLEQEADSGIRFIRKYADPGATCEPGTRYAALLCEYVLRAESGALSTFQQDYAQEIIAAKAEVDADAFAAAMGYTEEDDAEGGEASG